MKSTQKIRFILEFAALKCLVFAIRALPWFIAVKFGEFFGLLISKIVYKRFERAVKNIQKTFPDKTPKEVKTIATESFINIGRMAAEFIKASSMSRKKLFKHIEFYNIEEIIKRNNTDGLGGILHIGHFVNWELLGLAAGYVFNKTAFVARPLSNPYVDAQLTKMRTSNGLAKINAYNPFFASFKYLKKGYMIGILSDQSVASSPLYMNFLGRPAEVGAMSAVLSIKMQVPVYPAFPHRKNGKIIIDILPPILPPAQYSQQAVYDLTRKLNDIYEDWIRKEPSSWLWAHNRWKREKHSFKKMQEQNHQNGAKSE
jgi:KDO2-lipid IV(A) lauroyltransferase